MKQLNQLRLLQFRRLVIGVLVLLTMLGQSLAQTTFLDAERIFNNVDGEKVEDMNVAEILNILYVYAEGKKDAFTFNDVQLLYEKNPYITRLLERIVTRLNDNLFNNDTEIDSIVKEVAKLQAQKDKLEKLIATQNNLNRDLKAAVAIHSVFSFQIVLNPKSLKDRLKHVVENLEVAEDELQKKVTLRSDLKERLKGLYSTAKGHLQGASAALTNGKLDVSPEYLRTGQQTAYVQLTVASPDQTNLIDGAATFVANRIREELRLEFFRKFYSYFDDEKITALTILFPKTTALCKNFGAHSRNTSLSLLKVAFESDLRRLVYNLPVYLQKTDFPDKNLTTLVAISVKSLQDVSLGTNPSSIMLQANTELSDKYQNTEFGMAFQFLQAFSVALMDENGTASASTWLSSEKFQRLRNDQFLTDVFLGLLHQRLLMAGNLSDERLRQLKRFEDPELFTKVLKELHATLTDLDATYKVLRARKVENLILTPQESASYYSSFLVMVRFAYRNFCFVEGLSAKEDQDRFDLVMSEIFQSYSSVLARNYPATVFHTVNVFNAIAPKDSRMNDGLQEFIHYGTFIAEIANATSAAEISSIIESISLPPGSYRINRLSKWSIALAVYPGVIGGLERKLTYGKQPWVGNLGFTAPVGLAFSWGRARKATDLEDSKKKDFLTNGRYDKERLFSGQSVSLFITLIDLGAPVLYRLGSESAFPSAKVSQILSPGISFVYGLRNTPASLFAGTQITPELREIKDVNNQIISKPAWRFNLGVTLDLPVVILKRKDGLD